MVLQRGTLSGRCVHKMDLRGCDEDSRPYRSRLEMDVGSSVLQIKMCIVRYRDGFFSPLYPQILGLVSELEMSNNEVTELSDFSYLDEQQGS